MRRIYGKMSAVVGVSSAVLELASAQAFVLRARSCRLRAQRSASGPTGAMAASLWQPLAANNNNENRAKWQNNFCRIRQFMKTFYLFKAEVRACTQLRSIRSALLTIGG